MRKKINHYKPRRCIHYMRQRHRMHSENVDDLHGYSRDESDRCLTVNRDESLSTNWFEKFAKRKAIRLLLLLLHQSHSHRHWNDWSAVELWIERYEVFVGWYSSYETIEYCQFSSSDHIGNLISCNKHGNYLVPKSQIHRVPERRTSMNDYLRNFMK